MIFDAHEEPNVPADLCADLGRVDLVKIRWPRPRYSPWYARGDLIDCLADEMDWLGVPVAEPIKEDHTAIGLKQAHWSPALIRGRKLTRVPSSTSSITGSVPKAISENMVSCRALQEQA
jgi:hypothetical protein